MKYIVNIMDVTINILQLLWIAGLAFASLLVVIDLMTVNDSRRDMAKVHHRMKTAICAFATAFAAKAAKVVSQLLGG